jgi:hypothetical protein
MAGMGPVVVPVWAACVALGYVVGRNKGRGTAGLLLGLLLVPNPTPASGLGPQWLAVRSNRNQF